MWFNGKDGEESGSEQWQGTSFTVVVVAAVVMTLVVVVVVVVV